MRQENVGPIFFELLETSNFNHETVSQRWTSYTELSLKCALPPYLLFHEENSTVTLDTSHTLMKTSRKVTRL